MNWDQLRNRYPQQWLLVEAVNAYSALGKRVLDDLRMIESFPASSEALLGYAKLRHESPDRELYVFHTSRDHLDITERQRLGVRAAG